MKYIVALCAALFVSVVVLYGIVGYCLGTLMKLVHQ